MKEVGLSNSDKVALVDDEDYSLISRTSWHLWLSETGVGYARGTKDGQSVYMHWLVMGGKYIDHIDCDGLNNQRSNLRFVTRSQNMRNRRKVSAATSKYKGVNRPTENSRWEAGIFYEGKRIYLGQFDNEVDAAKAYNYAAIELFGEYARINELS